MKHVWIVADSHFTSMDFPEVRDFYQARDERLKDGQSNAVQNWHDNFLRFLKRVKNERPDRVVDLGDCINNGTSGELEYYREVVNKTDVPFLHVPGNHDVGEGPDPDRIRQYEKCFGEPHWAFDLEAFRLIGVNTSCLWKSSDELIRRELDWLIKAVTDARDKPIMVFMHVPLFRKHADEENSFHVIDKPLRHEIIEILSAASAVHVYAGHTHYFEEPEHTTLAMTIVPGTLSHYRDWRPGFLKVKLHDDIKHEIEWL